jgi:hypothetical protein
MTISNQEITVLLADWGRGDKAALDKLTPLVDAELRRIDERGDVRITDFGIAALTESLHAAREVAGTPAYMSPEQLDGRELTVASDIYSLGLCIPLAQYAQLLLPRLLGERQPSLATTSNLLPELGLLGLGGFIPLLINQATASLMFPFIIISILLFFTMLFRRERLGIAASWLLFYVALNLNFGEATPLSLLLGAILPTVLLAALTRFGLLALIATHFYTHILPFYPVTTEFSAWYATSFLLQLFVLGAVLLCAFHTSLAGQPLFRGRFLEE